MNTYEIKAQFERLCRTAGLSEYDEYKNDWITLAYAMLAKHFEIPSLKMEETILSVANQATYSFPYPYDGLEVSIIYDGKPRLDPYSEDMLDLAYERRTGGRGPVKLYDWAGIRQEDGLVVVDAVITNRSAVVTSAGNAFTEALSAPNFWVRFDPWTVADITYNPGDFGYRIGTWNNAGQITLEEHYRGPTGTTTCRIRPAETQIFRLYGIPQQSDKDIDLKVFRRPRRLYNNEDVPEWPGLGSSIADIAIAVGLRHLERYQEAERWVADGFGKLEALKRRRRAQGVLTPDLPDSMITGRRTGVQTVRLARYGGFR